MLKKYGHIIPVILMIIPFIYIMYESLNIASKKIKLSNQREYTSYFTSVEISPEIKTLAHQLGSVQACLDYVTNIPYKVHHFRAREPLETIRRNYGDCDDKSNLLSSLLSALAYENYIVLVPEHAFVIVNLNRELLDKKALRFNGKSYYVLESTAKNSTVGFKLQYSVNDIEAVIDPLEKSVLQTGAIGYY